MPIKQPEKASTFGSQAVNPLDPIAIQNVLSRYCEALDTKNFDLLDKVFVEDVDGNYPFNPDLQGVKAVKEAIQNRYVGNNTQQNIISLSYTIDILFPYLHLSHSSNLHSLTVIVTRTELFPFPPYVPLRFFTNNSTSLGPIRTHHSLTTQQITIGLTSVPIYKTANATTHFIGAHLGQGPHQGKVLTAYGRYVDELVCLKANGDDFEGVQGASGIWRIKKRTVLFTGRVGDEMIMKEY